jgi:hypothetical protein
MSSRPTFLDAWIAAFDEADDSAKREIAARLRPYLASGPKRLLNAKEKAQQLGLNPETLVRMARVGRVPGAVQAGRGWRFPEGQLEITSVRAEVPRAVSRMPARLTGTRTRSTAAAIRGPRAAESARGAGQTPATKGPPAGGTVSG